MLKKIIFLALAVLFTSLVAQTPFAVFDFNDETTNPTSGTGSIELIGGTTSSYAAGATGNPDRALNTTSYPEAESSPETAGIQVNVSTTGLSNIQINWDHKHSNTAANRIRLQFTVNGSNWINFEATEQNASNTTGGEAIGFDNGLFITTNDGWYVRTADFTGIEGIDDNPNFAIRFVTAFSSGSSSYQPSNPTGTYGTGGTVRFDNLTFLHQDANTVVAPTAEPAGGTYNELIYVELTCSTPQSFIFYTTDETEPSSTNGELYTEPIPINSTTILKFRAEKEGMNPSAVVTETYVFPVSVSSIDELRALTPGTGSLITITSEVIITFTQSFRGQKYIQDETGAILIDDYNSVIDTEYNVGDGITGLSGTISEYGNMLQFMPESDPGAPTSTGNTITPTIITTAQFLNNFDDFESQLVTIQDINFTTTGTFANGITYEITDGTNLVNLRTTFYDVDYIGQPIPENSVDMTGILNARSDGNYITPRFMADFADMIDPPTANPTGGVYSEPVNVELTCTTEDADIYYTLDGSNPDATNGTLYSTPITINTTTTLKFRAEKDGMDPSVVITEIYAFPVTVNNLAELRQQPVNSVVTINSEIFISFVQTYRNQKYVQDETAGLLIDDDEGILSYDFNIGDGITGLTGTLSEFNNMLELIPLSDTGEPSSTNNTISPTTITPTQFLNNFEDFECQLVLIENVSFETAGVFENGEIYELSTGSDPIEFRTTFYNVEYIGYLIPTETIDVIGILNSRDTGNYITSRQLSDLGMTDNTDIVAPQTTYHQLKGNYPNPFNPNTTIAFELKHPTKVDISIYNVKGQKIVTLVNDYFNQGNHTINWNGKDSNNKDMTTGIYFYRMATPETLQVKKAILMK
ncbi:MAG: chitobiase/beta-hexosaminidase C-terminal domain-containing protein [Candidatus Cloacimonetes bacterium]|nr:chitobiase/beta-hexosaminidase C-terminal domain-containing protein [Candidatus Cloacimonadota bacterium]